MWERLSKVFARGAKGSVDFFGTEAPGTIWMDSEKPILTGKLLKVNYHP
jgi:hypothetical protein